MFPLFKNPYSFDIEILYENSLKIFLLENIAQSFMRCLPDKHRSILFLVIEEIDL